MTLPGLTRRVPYYAQYESAELLPDLIAGTRTAADDPRWPDSGAEGPEEYAGIPAGPEPDLTAGAIRRHLAGGGLALISVHKSIRDAGPEVPPSRGGHLVLAVGATDDALLIHNPSGLPGVSQQYAPVSWARLAAFSAGRGVLLG